MAIWSAIGSIGGALIGGLLGKKSQEKANDENVAYQREFAQHGIRWRAEDAKAAGLHPLYAMGGSGAAFTPSSQAIFSASEGASMGQNIGRAIGAANDEARSREAQLALIEAQRKKTDMETLVLASDIKRQEQAINVAKPAPFLPPGVVAQSYPVQQPGAPLEVGPWVDGQHYLTIPEGASPASRAAAAAPYLTNAYGEAARSLRRWSFPGVPGGEVLLPHANDFAEAMESLENPINQSAILYANAVHYGPKAGREIADWLRTYARSKLREFNRQGR